jgi:serine/threonine-protein kinase HipA
LTHYAGSRNRLVFSPDYLAVPEERRATFTLAQTSSKYYFERVRSHQLRLASVLSNLLPEGALREWMSKQLKIQIDDEFAMLASTGHDLPGAISAIPFAAGDIPDWALPENERIEPVTLHADRYRLHFSLAGIQMKFSGTHQDGRYRIASSSGDDYWIIKTPSTVHPHVPENEYTAMRLVEAAGVQIPEIRLIPLEMVDNLPHIPLPDKAFAYAIRRFDRQEGRRIHSEDFAQVFELYPHHKYGSANYEQIGRTIYQYSQNGLEDLQQMARRLLVNILLANGDAHIKNWSLVYPDRIHSKLAPVYDIVSTLLYIPNEAEIALNLAKQKNWYLLNMEHFRIWTRRIGAPWQAIRVHLVDVLEKARDNWSDMLDDLPMDIQQKIILRDHRKRLQTDFCIL